MDLVRARIGALLTPARGLALALACAVALSAPVAAQAQPCECTIKWAKYFSAPSHKRMRDWLDIKLIANGISFADSRKVRRRIKAYADYAGSIPDRLCSGSRAREKLCEAAIACVGMGGIAYQTSKYGGASERAAMWTGLGACETAILAVLLTP